ncbi:MAG TPA: Ku protein [Acidimicrobiia bacterium]|jgi:DNA end-binding protein Ku|nr:Ku protein [Acidimicrobiia bacterium]
MPRSIWKGAISFGLVTIPVALYTATESKTPKFKMLRGTDHSPIKYKRVAESDGEEVVWDDIVRGYEVEKGKYVVFTDEELEAATAADGNRLVDVVQFVDESEIDPIYYKSSYYLAPERTGVKAYKILLEALKDKGRVGLAKVSIRDKQQLATVRAKDGVLVMETMYWPDEIREPEFEELDGDVELRKEEVKMAQLLIDGLTAEFDPEAFKDSTREAIEVAAQKKVDGQEIVAPEAPEPTKVVDLLEALKASVEATKKRKAG